MQMHSICNAFAMQISFYLMHLQCKSVYVIIYIIYIVTI